MSRPAAQDRPQPPSEEVLALVRALAKQHAAEDHARELARESRAGA